MLSSVRTFPCPKCNELVMTGVDKCRHCASPIDATAAATAADAQDKVNSAYSDASFMRNLSAGMWVFFLIRFIPFIGIAGWVGMLGLMVGVPVKLILWQVKFGRLQTEDPDYKKAKTNRLIAFLIWLPLPILLVLGLLMMGALAVSSNR